MDLYDYIFQRQSIRKYSPEPIVNEDAVIKLLDQLPKLPASRVNLHFHSLDPDSMKRIAGICAPHLVVARGILNKDNLVQAGYALEYLQLELAAMGIGSCLLNKLSRLPQSNQVLGALVLGHADDSINLYRDRSDFRRLPLNKILKQGSPNLVQTQLLEAVRHAPSLNNSQPWRLALTGSALDLYLTKPSLPFLKDKRRQIHGGIALCHLEVAALHYDINYSFINDSHASGHPEYIKTIKLN